jgi:hypothetical protein
MGMALFLVLLFVDFLVVKPRRAPAPLAVSSPAKARIPSRAIWVVGIACFLGSLSLLLGGVRAHDTWEIVGGSLGSTCG